MIFERIWAGVPDALSLGLLWGVMAIGVYITYKLLDVADLSVDGSFATGGCVSAILTIQGMHSFASIGIAFLAGMAAGLVTGVLHTKLKIPAILSGILTMLGLYSINLRISNGRPNHPMPNFGSNKVSTVIDHLCEQWNLDQKTAVIFFGAVLALVIIGLLYWFFGTELGSLIRATGNNADMARAMGGNTDNMKILGLVLSNGFVAFSGAIVAQSQRYGDVNMGTGTIVVGLASIIIGEVIFGKNRHFALRLLSVFVGSMVYRLVIAVVLVLGMNPNDMKILTAGIVAFALSVPTLSSYVRNTLQKSANKKEQKKRLLQNATKKEDR